MRVLITGISGFCGSYLAELLVNKGDDIFGISKPKESIDNLYLIANKVKNYFVDILSAKETELVIKDIRPDIIYHLAAEASVGLSFSRPQDTVRINVIGTINILEGLRNLEKFPRVMLVTSGEVYGDVPVEKLPVREDFALRPLHPYAFSKVAVHYLGYEYYHSYGIPIIEARSFNIIGPRQRKGFVVPDFCEQIALISLGKIKNTIYVGNLEEGRDFIDVRDAVRSYELIAEKGQLGSVYHVCSGKSWLIKDILNTLISIANIKIEIKVDKNKIRPSRIPLMCGSHQKITEELGWEPRISIEETLKETFEYWMGFVKKIYGN
jgi:GDP-4-dehydro-6-deoxy-D-mannose reductase